MLNRIFKEISNAFDKYKIPYMIIGGQAALLYREPRFTNDIDITLGIGTDDIELIFNLCKELNFSFLINNPKDFVLQTMVLPVIDKNSGIRIDFIFSYTNYEREAITRANIVDIDGGKVSFCSLEDLMILKIFAGRQRDLDDVSTIIRKNPNYNRKMVIENLKELGKAIDSDLVTRLEELEKK